METPSTSKHLPADERRAATVEAVVALAAQTNPSDISTTAIAKHMGVTQGALFKHFPTKESIIEAVMGWVADRLLARIDAATRKAATPLAALEAVFMTHVEFVTIHPGVPRMLFGESQRAEMNGPKRLVQALIARYSERVRALLAQGKAAGEIRANMDEGSAALLFVGMVQGLVMQSLLAGDVRQMSDQAAGVFALFRDALTGAQA